MNLAFIQGLVAGALLSGTTLLYATLGEVVGQRSGIVNLGIEGLMLVGAAAGFAVAAETGSAVAGIVAAAIAGGLFNLLFGILVITRGANQLASGLAFMFFGFGLSALIGRSYVGTRIDGLDKVTLPILSDLPFFGPALFRHDLLVHLQQTVMLRLVVSGIVNRPDINRADRETGFFLRWSGCSSACR